MRGVFLYLRPFCPTGDYSAKRLRKCERKTHHFSRKLLFFPEKPVDFSPQLVHSSLHSLAICPFPHHNDKTVPTFRTQNPRKIAQSRIHLDDPRLLAVENRFFLTPQPHFKRLFRALFSAKRLPFVPKSPLFLSLCGRKATGNVGLLTNILYLCFLKCADLSSFFHPICRKPRCDTQQNDR